MSLNLVKPKIDFQKQDFLRNIGLINWSKMFKLAALLVTLVATSLGDECNSRDTTYGKVCVCDSTYCDTVPQLDVTAGNYQIYSTSSSKLGFNSATGSFQTVTDSDAIGVNVDASTTYQSIIGFGGAFTDSTGININSLPSAAQDNLMNSYFSESGNQYSLCRVPVGGTDFSTRAYSYDDYENDTTLEYFSLADDDLQYKIPYIQKAKELTGDTLKLFSSVWTAPPWMKSNNDWAGIGWLKSEYYQLWADYMMRFFDEYENHNVSFWGMTPPERTRRRFLSSVLQQDQCYGMGADDNGKAILYFGAARLRKGQNRMINKWIGENLGPTLRSSKHKDIKLIIHDDNRVLFENVRLMLSKPTTLSYTDGVAFHWYTDMLTPPSTTGLDEIQEYREDLFVLATEACAGFLNAVGLEQPVEKGSWNRGALYADSIMQNLKYGASGWVDWNLALDENGAPTYIDNFVDSPILVNATLQEFYKQPMFYVMGHFSKFLRPGSVRIETTISGTQDNLQALAFLRPDDLIALVIYNSGTSDVNVQVQQSDENAAVIEIEAKSINTVLYNRVSGA
ncbi:hypothetical protein NQ318_018709 [Aromia moschata]|uniref:Glucosylceramidase n=1 Tax=Aromia moschata TaxID=1265417 RepID=A0AAV8ZHL0_9CUCU|nr:hypothetical protein NQ318_018709 [Aromia moschata]